MLPLFLFFFLLYYYRRPPATRHQPPPPSHRNTFFLPSFFLCFLRCFVVSLSCTSSLIRDYSTYSTFSNTNNLTTCTWLFSMFYWKRLETIQQLINRIDWNFFSFQTKFYGISYRETRINIRLSACCCLMVYWPTTTYHTLCLLLSIHTFNSNSFWAFLSLIFRQLYTLTFRSFCLNFNFFLLAKINTISSCILPKRTTTMLNTSVKLFSFQTKITRSELSSSSPSQSSFPPLFT